MSRGRHRRPGLVSKTVATGTTVASGAAISGVAVISSHGTALASDIPQVPQHVQEYKAEAVQAVRAVPRTYTVRSGDYLSKIAKAHCATASDWTGIYERNKNVIGPNPDLIEVGQRLVLDCHVVQVYYKPPVQHTTSTPAPPSYHGSGGSGAAVTTVSTGYYDPTNTVLSASQIETLWVDAGGPSWAEYQAYLITQCESGGNRFAYNPSGATGLWQILGSVVPGNLDDAWVNAENAVSKFKASGDSWAQWVCQP